MTTRTTPSPIELMSAPDIREAMDRGDAVAVLDAGLGAVLFADAATRGLLGLAAPVADGPVPLDPALPAPRRLRSVLHGLDTRGTASLALRTTTSTSSRVLQARLSRRADGVGGTVLLTIAAALTAGDADALLADAGLGKRAGGVFLGGLMRRATPAFDADSVPGLEARIAAFDGGSDAFIREDDGAAKVTFARAAFGHVLVIVEPSETPARAAEPAVLEVIREAEAKPFSPGFSSFTVKRPALGEGRGTMSMRALLQRWHLRGPSDGPGPTPVPAPPVEADGAIAPSPVAGTAPSNAEPLGSAANAAEPGPAHTDEADGANARGAPVDEADIAWDEPAGTGETASYDDRASRPIEDDRTGASFDDAASDSQDAADEAREPSPREAGDEASLPRDDGAPPPSIEAAVPLAAVPLAAVPLAEGIEAGRETVSAEDRSGSLPVRAIGSVEDDEDRSAMAAIERGSERIGPALSQAVVSPAVAADAGVAEAVEDAPATREIARPDAGEFLAEAQPDADPAGDGETPAAPAASTAPIDGEDFGEATVEAGAAPVPCEDATVSGEEPVSSDDAADDERSERSAETDTAVPEDAVDAGIAPQPLDTDDRPSAPSRTAPGAEPHPAIGFEPRFDGAPTRFVWQIDRDGAFRFLSPDFAAAVGPHAGDVVGRSFADVARVFGFDGTGEIARLLERRDTWSGRSILWPVEGSSRKVPVDLAALPVYGRDRSFDGFRGFGVVRMNESVADEEALGLHLVGGSPAATSDADAAPTAADDASPAASRTFETDRTSGVFGRRAEPPAPAAGPDEDAEPATKVIRLEERRRPRDGALSQSEEAAFRAIGAKLASPSEAESPGALRFADPAPAASGIAHEDEDETPEPEAEAAERIAAGEERASFDDGEAEPGLPAASVPVQPYDVSTSQPAPPDADAVGDAVPDGEILDGVAHASTPDGIEAEDAAVDDAHGPVEAPSDAAVPASGEPSVQPSAAAESDAPADPALFESLFASLPLAVLVQSRGRLIYANAEFSGLTGHRDAASLTAAGGLETLIADRGEAGTVLLRGADGQTIDVRAHMQRVSVGGRSALLMSFSRLDAGPAEPAAAPVADPSPVPADASPALEDLRQQVEELQAVLDTATDGVVLLDAGGAIRAMNGSAHALFGIGSEEAAGQHVSSLFAHESQKSMLDYLEMLRDDGIGGILNDGREVIGRVAQGGFIPLFVTVGRLSGERGWCVVIRDIAHWKRIEEDLVNARRQAEAASLHKSRFLANISHELRTPLNAIIGFADVMASECFGPIGNERYLEYLGDIKRSGHHVLDLVNDLLDISKIEAGKLDLAFEAVSLNEVVSEVVSLMQPQANRERVIVRSNLPSSVPPVVADRRTIRQIALNLVANAIRFTPAGGQIIASTTYTSEGEVLLRFRDSGIGMTEREIEIALTPFQQVHAPSATRGEGTGLGLPLTKAMVEANRAQFAIHSTPGEGTLVEIAFPSPRVLAD